MKLRVTTWSSLLERDEQPEWTMLLQCLQTSMYWSEAGLDKNFHKAFKGLHEILKGLHKALEGHNEVLNGCSKVLMVLSNAVFQGRLFMKPFRGFIRHLKVIIRFYELSKASNDLS